MKIALQSRTEKHVEIYFEKTRDAEIQRMLPQASTTLEEALDSFHRSVAPSSTSHGRTIYADGVYVGDIWCYCISENESPNAMVSYCIFEKQYWHRGVATCALKLFLSEIAEKFRLRQIGAFTFADNVASQKVLEANGFACTERFTENGIESIYYQLQPTP